MVYVARSSQVMNPVSLMSTFVKRDVEDSSFACASRVTKFRRGRRFGSVLEEGDPTTKAKKDINRPASRPY